MRMREFGSAIRLPCAPPASSSEPIDIAIPTHHRRHVGLDELHRVVDREAGVDRAARRVDVERDVLVGVLRLEVEHLRHDEVGDHVVDGVAEEDDALVEQARVDVEFALATGGALDDHRNQWHDPQASRRRCSGGDRACCGAGRRRPSMRSTRRVKRRGSSFRVSRTSAAGVRSSEHREQREVVALHARGGGAQLPGRERRERGAAAGDHAQRLEQLLGRRPACRRCRRRRRRAARPRAPGSADLGVGDDARAAVGGHAAAELQSIADAEVRLEQDDVGRGARDELEPPPPPCRRSRPARARAPSAAAP